MKKIYLLIIVLTVLVQYSHAQCTSANGGFIQASSTVYCGSPVTLTVINPQLQGNTQWVWYSGSCGGTQVGTGVSISVSPSTETTYYVRGEGGCTTSACRAPIVISSPGLGSITSVSTGVERCGFGTVTLTAQSDKGTINWYRTATEVVVRGTGTSFTAGAQNFGINTFYAEANNGGCVTSPRTAVTFNVKDLPGFSSFGSSAACPGETATITAIPNANSSFSGWYDAPTGGNLVSASGVFTTPPLTSPVTYYGIVTHTNGCTDNATWTPNIKAVPTLSSVTSGERCGSGSVNLSAVYTVSGTSISQYHWYDSPTGGTLLSTQQNFSTSSIANTTTYFVTALTVQGCVNPTREPVLATIKPIPTITSTSPASRCGAGTLSLSAAGSAGTLEWFNAATGGTQVATGATFNTTSLTQSTPYFVQSTNNGCTSSRSTVTATINPIPTVTGFSNSRCDAGTVGLGATSNGTISWFSASTGGSALATGESFTTPSITTTTVYHLQATLNGCTTPTRTTVSAIVRTTPSVTSTTAAERCGEGAINLTATTSAGNINWYDAQSGGNLLVSALTLPLNISNTSTYYAAAISNDCESVRTPVVATVKSLPSLAANDVSRCGSGQIELIATSNGNIGWFTGPSGGAAVVTGNILSNTFSTTTDYYLEANLNGCVSSSRLLVKAIVLPIPAQPTITQNNSNEQNPVLTSNVSSGNQWFRNDMAITGATNPTYTIADEGAYKVQVNNSGCLSPFSSVVNYVITGFEVADKDMLKLYPNPAADELIINLNGFDVDKLVNLAVVDLMGRSLSQSTALGGDEVRVKVSGYSTGQYLVLARQGNRKIIRSFIKTR